jgi:hypothetical protein
MAGAKPSECHLKFPRRNFSRRNFCRPNFPTIVRTMGWLVFVTQCQRNFFPPNFLTVISTGGTPYLPSRSGEIPLLDF